MSIFDLLLPREIKFFEYLNQQVQTFYEACKILNEIISKLSTLSDAELHGYNAKIDEYESEGDRLERFIIQQLDITFITPLDREDIHSIVVHIDNSLDYIKRLAHKIENYKIKDPKQLSSFSAIILHMAMDLTALITGLKYKSKVLPLVKEIHQHENEADQLFHTTIEKLFESENAIEIIKFKDIYEETENLSNSIYATAKLVRGVIVKS